MNVSLLRIMNTKVWDFRPDMAQTYANALKNAIELHLGNDIEKQHGYFLSKKGYQKDGKTLGANFEDKLYVGNIYRVENHLYWNDEELQDDDEIINVVVVDGPVTRDGDGCSYGTKDFRDQVMYANTIPQVVGHLFVINTPGGQSSCRNDYDMMIADCREKGKPTVAFVDGMCCSSGVNLASRCDRTIVMNPKDEFGCIGSMAAFWAVAHDTVSDDGYRYVELVGKDCPDKNAWWREAAKGEYEKLQAELDKDTEEFHQSVRENRPLVTDDLLTGKVYEAAEVIPALVDEIGDMDRAIEAVFELAGEQLQPARFMVAEPKENPLEEDLAPGEEDTTHKNNNDMTQEEIKAQEAAAAAEAAQEEKPADEEVQKPAEEAEKPADEEQKPADEEEQKPAEEEEKPADEEEKPADEEEKPADEEEKPADEEEKPADEEEQKPADAQPTEEEIQNAQEEIDKIQETLHTAEATIAERDSKIEELSQKIAELTTGIDGHKATAEQLQADLDGARADIEKANGTIAERDKEIADLKKKVADLQAEVKEMAGSPAPMTNGDSGIPAGNGTGDKPKQNRHQRIKSDMTYEEIRAAIKEK